MRVVRSSSEWITEWNDPDTDRSEVAKICDTCGWWLLRREDYRDCCHYFEFVESGLAGCLKSLDDIDERHAIDEVHQYLIANYTDRNNIQPETFERVVGRVFALKGYDVRVCGKSGDGGIDAILTKSDGSTIGVQVKRYKKSIEVEQIRSLTGSLFIAGIPRGIFVTTSTFQRGAHPTAKLAAARGIPIELIDADRFLEILKDTFSIADDAEQFLDQGMKQLGRVKMEWSPAPIGTVRESCGEQLIFPHMWRSNQKAAGSQNQGETDLHPGQTVLKLGSNESTGIWLVKAMEGPCEGMTYWIDSSLVQLTGKRSA